MRFFRRFTRIRKSTEINRLAARLRKEERAHLLPIVINAEEMLDLHNPIAEADVLSMILYKTDAAVLDPCIASLAQRNPFSAGFHRNKRPLGFLHGPFPVHGSLMHPSDHPFGGPTRLSATPDHLFWITRPTKSGVRFGDPAAKIA